MKKQIKMTVTSLALALSMSLSGNIVAEEPSFDRQVEYRQAVMTILAYNMKGMGDMLKGKTPYDAEKMQSHASDVAAMSTIEIVSAFPEDSINDESDALEDIWMDFETFEQKFTDFQTAAKGIEVAAKTGDQAVVGAAMKDLGASCKGCHKKFKN